MKSVVLDISEKSRLFAALADETRLEILNLLILYPNICVSEIANRLGVSSSAVSQQCKLLELSGILRRIRRGQKVCYQIKTEDPDVRKALKLIKE
jgi:DNA-binding transcriptional ArsR family regulator